MEIFNEALAQRLFSNTTPNLQQLDNLAKGALKAGIDLYMNKNYDGALKQFRRAIGLSPSSQYAADAANYMANAHLQLNDVDGAIKDYQTAIKLNPFRTDSRVSLGKLFYAQDRFKEAEDQFREAVRIEPVANNRYALGEALLAQEKYNEAENQFREVIRLQPNGVSGYYGLGQTFARKGSYEDAINQFEAAIDRKADFYEGYEQIGYAAADMGDMEKAQSIVDLLDKRAPQLANLVSGYMYKVDPAKVIGALSTSTFSYMRSRGTTLASMDSYLATANAEKTYTMVFQFDKTMDRASVENVLNWSIGRSTNTAPGGSYNFGLPVSDTEVQLASIPTNVYYDADRLTATVYFKVQQNETATGTLDPVHLQFSFKGKDSFGYTVNPKFDQFTGFSGVF